MKVKPVLKLPSIVAMLIVFQVTTCLAASSTIRISQVYGGGGNTGAIYQNDFVELFNASSSPVNITGWTIQYAAATSSTWHATNLSGVINAGGYYLIQFASGGAVGRTLPAPDATGSTNLSATDGKVALVNSTTTISSDCPSDNSIIDLVGYGSAADCFEGTGPSPTPSNTESIIRALNGCTDTDNNSSDFITATPSPRNSSAATNICSPQGISNLTVDSNIHIWTQDNKVCIDFTNAKVVNAMVEIFDLSGQKLSEQKFEANGIYYIILTNSKSAFIMVRLLNEGKVITNKLFLLN